VQSQKQPLLNTLRDLVAIESGSGDRAGLDQISQLIYDRLQALGGTVEFIEPPAETYRMHDTPVKVGRMVKATFRGTGTKKILLIAHMDTVYLKGMGAKQPFRIDGNKAYGLGIGDDKAGIAVILHTLAALQNMQFKDYGQLTVLINGDEEISSPASRGTLTQLGAEHDLTMSHEGSPVSQDHLSLATAGIAPLRAAAEAQGLSDFTPLWSGQNASDCEALPAADIAHKLLQAWT
jgi:glutamate carboxypeptidase